jgi:hypothetical protein
MAGPIISILINNLTQTQIQTLEETLASIAIVDKSQPNIYKLLSTGKKEKKRIGKQAVLRPFELSILHNLINEDEDILSFLKPLGYTQVHSLHIKAQQNLISDHKILALLAIKLADLFNGLIYLHGTVLPHRNQIIKPTQLYPYINYNEALAFSQTIEGENHIYNFKTVNKGNWFSQFVSSTYLQNWLANAAFRLCK